MVISCKEPENILFCFFDAVDIYVQALDVTGSFPHGLSWLLSLKHDFGKCPPVPPIKACDALGALLLRHPVVGRRAARVPWGCGPQGGSLTWDLAPPAASWGTATRQPPPWTSPNFLFLVAVCPTNAPQTPGAARRPSIQVSVRVRRAPATGGPCGQWKNSHEPRRHHASWHRQHGHRSAHHQLWFSPGAVIHFLQMKKQASCGQRPEVAKGEAGLHARASGSELSSSPPPPSRTPTPVLPSPAPSSIPESFFLGCPVEGQLCRSPRHKAGTAQWSPGRPQVAWVPLPWLPKPLWSLGASGHMPLTWLHRGQGPWSAFHTFTLTPVLGCQSLSPRAQSMASSGARPTPLSLGHTVGWGGHPGGGGGQ